VIGLLAAATHASPYWTATPPATLAEHDGELAGAVGYLGVLAPYTDQPVLSAWARWAATDRWEVIGGAWLPIAPTLVGVHGTWRYAVVGGGGDDGAALTVGLGAGAALQALEALSLTVPLTVGYRRDAVQAWLGASGALYPALGPLGTIGADAGLAVDVQGFPVFLALGADAGSFAAVSALVGVGYGMDQ
jgi:hypothetical protein